MLLSPESDFLELHLTEKGTKGYKKCEICSVLSLFLLDVAWYNLSRKIFLDLNIQKNYMEGDFI